MQTASQDSQISISSKLYNLEEQLTKLAMATESILVEEEKKKQEFKVRSKNALYVIKICDCQNYPQQIF